MIKPDILANIKFYNIEQGGRKSPTPKDYFGCPVDIDGQKNDCRLLLNVIGSIKPGESKTDVPIKFLCSDTVIKKLSIGKKFFLWEVGYIGEGIVINIFHD